MAQIPKAYNKMILMLVTLIVSIASTHAQNKTSSPYSNQKLPEVTQMDPNKLKEIQADFKGIKYKFLLVGNQKYVLPEKYEKQASLYYNFKVKPDDVTVITFPRSGTEWTMEVIWLLYNNFDYTTAKSKRIIDRITFLERSILANEDIEQLPADNIKSPRLLATHLPLSLIPSISQSANKIIYVAWNPKDLLLESVEFFKSNKRFDFVGDIAKYWSYLENDEVLYSPYWQHLKEGVAQKKNPNVLFLYIEEEPLDRIKKISSFLNKTITDQQLQQLVAYMNTTMKFDKGTWKNVLSKELNEKMNAWIKKNIENSGIEFPSIDIYS